ncbi:MAG: di-trans,poly-cis-decaprenylcistransferase [Legionellales bacterium RIFCSPHIGHO2_12_FULL_42_9]|nr:MAG: di-trans,poly-cis-decaprenylcistransferase [Legionellales bacterium RIFCSPHIGHO2_12_FULL_42_9]
MLNVPQHVAIIMDGNGRWAESRGLMRFEGHIAGIKTVKTVIKCCLNTKIPVLSLFAFSSENWLRPAEEVDFLMQLFLETLQKEVQELNKNQICLRFTGDRLGLSPAIREQMHLAEELTAQNQALILNLALNYGGRWEIVRAARRIAEDIKAGNLDVDSINEQAFGQYLATGGLPDPDLFIRTSGETRISNFFLWQLAYTELYFSSTLWPDFTKEAFEKALVSFQERERRYGKTSQQINELSDV